MASKLDTPEDRMIALKDWAISAGIPENDSQYWELIEFPGQILAILEPVTSCSTGSTS